MKKYISFTFLVISLFPLLMGCSGFPKRINEIQKTQEEHAALVNKMIQTHEQILSNLQSSCKDIEGQIEELSQKTTNADINYSKLQTALDALNYKTETRDNSLDNIYSEIQKRINNIELKVKTILEIENDLQAKVAALQSQLSDISSEIKQNDTNYSELGYSNQWLRNLSNKIDRQKEAKNKEENNKEKTE